MKNKPSLSTREKILSAAADLLEKSGIKAVSQLAVAKEVGIPQGQLTYHFPKRADLILAVSDIALNRVAEFIFKASAKGSPKTEKQLHELIWQIARQHSRTRAMLGLVVEADENTEVRHKLIEQEARARALIAMALGVPPTDPQVSSVQAVLIGFGLLAFVHGGTGEEHLKKDFFFTLKLLKTLKPRENP